MKMDLYLNLKQNYLLISQIIRKVEKNKTLIILKNLN